ncbi:MAG: hypothetical protein GY785_09565 [Gammaproteobacteria bacterium]|nr:hypothetical protein [Gammaproteobacteria bacterium]
MLSSLLFFACILVNSCLIVYCLLPPLASAVLELGRGLRCVRLYLACRLDETREQALRQRCRKLFAQLLRLAVTLCAITVAYSPSLLFALYRSGVSAAFISIEALAGMSVGAVTAAILRRRS